MINQLQTHLIMVIALTSKFYLTRIFPTRNFYQIIFESFYAHSCNDLIWQEWDQYNHLKSPQISPCESTLVWLDKLVAKKIIQSYQLKEKGGVMDRNTGMKRFHKPSLTINRNEQTQECQFWPIPKKTSQHFNMPKSTFNS